MYSNNKKDLKKRKKIIIVILLLILLLLFFLIIVNFFNKKYGFFGVEYDNNIKVDFISLDTVGSGEYKSSATRKIKVSSSNEIEYAKYCITTKDICTPNKSQNNLRNNIMRVSYSSNELPQRICIQVKDKKSNQSKVICDELTVKVDNEKARIKDNDKDTLIEKEPYNIEDLFEVTYGVSKGSVKYYYYILNNGVEQKNPLTDLSTLPSGNIDIEIVVTSGNGLVSKKRKTFTIRKNKIKYDYATNGGTSSTSSSYDVSYNEQIDLSAIAVKPNYEFVGWNTNKDAKVGLTTLTSNGDMTLYAIFRKKIKAEYEIYNKQGLLPATSEFSIQECILYNNEKTCEVKVPILNGNDGYVVHGWSKTLGNHEIDYIGGETIKISQNSKYYSVTSNKKQLVGKFYYYEKDKIKATISKCSLYNGETSCVLREPVNLSKYKNTQFVDWSSDKKNYNSSILTITEDKEYYAYYNKTINIVYHDGLDNNKTKEQGNIYYILSQEGEFASIPSLREPDKIDGYTTLGWREDKIQNVATKLIGEKANENGSNEFYAVYQRPISLSYNANGGLSTPTTQSKTQYLNSAVGPSSHTFTVANEISTTGAVFDSWRINSISGERVSASSDMIISEDTVLFADFKDNVKPDWTLVSAKSSNAINNQVTKVDTVKIVLKGSDSYSDIASYGIENKISLKIGTTKVEGDIEASCYNSSKEIICMLEITNLEEGSGTLNLDIAEGTLIDTSNNQSDLTSISTDLTVVSKPVCVWEMPTYIRVNDTANATLTCSSTSGFKSTALTTSALESSDVDIGRITAVSLKESTDTTATYNVTLRGIAYGKFYIKLLDKSLVDTVDIGNSTTTSNNVTIVEFDVLSSSVALNLASTNKSQISIIGGNYGTVSYSSSNTNVATVSNTGLITAVTAGTATITVTESLYNLTSLVTVNVTNSLVINNVLDHLNTSNTASTITSGSTYTTTLTPTNTLVYGRPDTIEVYIGGVKTTNYTYNSVNGSLSIPSVTNDLKIVATAKVLSDENISFEKPKIVTVGNLGTVSITQAYQLRLYQFTPTTSGSYTFYTNDSVASTRATDPYAYLFTLSDKVTIASLDAAAETYAATGKYSDLQSQCLIYNDDGGDGYNFKFSYTLNANQTYYVAIRTYTPSKIQTFTSFIIQKN